MRKITTPITLLVALGVVTSLASSAAAQDALGAGDVLDSNLNVQGSRNSAPAPNDYRIRNLLITGDVAGGRGFRGSVGYGAESDFRGELGSNDLFQFRAQSALSSLDYIRGGGRYDQFQIGRDTSIVEYRRSGTASSLGSLPEQMIQPGNLEGFRMRLDRATLDADTVGSSLLAVNPIAIGIALPEEEGDQPQLLYASALQGVTTVPARNVFETTGIGTYDLGNLIDEATEGEDIPTPGQPFNARFEDLLNDQRLESTQMNERITQQYGAESTDLLERIAKRYALDDSIDAQIEAGLLTDLDQQFAELRKMLTGTDTDLMPVPTEPADPTALVPAPGAQTKPPVPGVTDPADPADSRDPGDPGDVIDLEALSGALRHGQRLDHLVADGKGRFIELMQTAEQRLRDGEYFWAERRFNRALRLIPDHPMATVGMGHSQLGAGLYLSAASTLRKLLVDRPEMIDLSYGPNLLPSRARLSSALNALEDRFDEQRDRDLLAFLYAYIGHQLDDRAVIEKGLNMMAQENPDDAMPPLLRSIWLEDDAVEK